MCDRRELAAVRYGPSTCRSHGQRRAHHGQLGAVRHSECSTQASVTLEKSGHPSVLGPFSTAKWCALDEAPPRSASWQTN